MIKAATSLATAHLNKSRQMRWRHMTPSDLLKALQQKKNATIDNENATHGADAKHFNLERAVSVRGIIL